MDLANCDGINKGLTHLQEMNQRDTVLKTCKLALWIIGVGVVCIILITSMRMRTFVPKLTSGPSGSDVTTLLTQYNASYSKGTFNFKIPEYGFSETTNKSMKTNIAFLKVHKAGSTTMQNLFFRFSIRHNLNLLLPMKGNFVHSNDKLVPLEPSQTFNIHCCHSIYKKSLFNRLIPGDAVFIGIIREPIDRIVSAAYYYRDVWKKPYLKHVPAANFIHNLIQHPEKYEKTHFSRTRNSMGWDFGFSKTVKMSDTNIIEDYIKQLDIDFAFVMVAEKFDESLVMMKRLLNWSFLDIVYLKSNTHSHQPVVLTKEELAKAREVNFLDFAIYDHFSKVFDEKLKSMDNEFDGEVECFKDTLAKVFTFCSEKTTTDNSQLFIPKSKWDNGFKMQGVECTKMKLAEVKFIDLLRKEKIQQFKDRQKI